MRTHPKSAPPAAASSPAASSPVASPQVAPPVSPTMPPLSLSPTHEPTSSTTSTLDLEKNTTNCTTPTPRSHSLLPKYLTTNINPRHSSQILLLCCFITGLTDSTLFNAYGTFVSGQTGNTILFGLGASVSHSTARPYRWAKSLIALICFSWGCAAFTHTMRRMGSLKRGTLVLSFLVQGTLVIIVGGFIQASIVEGRLHKLNNEMDWRQALPIALLSFQSAGQIVASRMVKINAIPTVVLTSMIHDIAADPRLLARDNKRRNQMVGAFCATLLGAVAGGFLSVQTGKIQNTLWVVGGIKFVIAGAWMGWPAAKEDGTLS